MKSKIVFASILALSCIFLLNRCGSNKAVPDMCFSKNVLPIFVSKCSTTGCHDGNKGNGGKDEGEGDFTNYDGIMKKVTPYSPLRSEIYTQCSGKNPSMPPKSSPQLSSTELEYIKFWIHTGAKNSDCTNVGCDSLNVTYSKRIQPLFKTWCIGCHEPGNPGGGVDLTTYEGTKACVDKLMPSLNRTGLYPMPKGAGALGSCDVRAVQLWINAGYPNN